MVGENVAASLKDRIREVQGFPTENILFYDITTLLQDADAFGDAIDLMAAPYRSLDIDMVVAMESRGFIFGAPLAYLLHAGFAPIRKLGKLPFDTVTREYQLEYATNTLEMHADAVQPGQRVLLVDDLLATGGTIAASIDIVRELGGDPVGVVVLVELESLKGRDKLASYGVEVTSFIRYP